MHPQYGVALQIGYYLNQNFPFQNLLSCIYGIKSWKIQGLGGLFEIKVFEKHKFH